MKKKLSENSKLVSEWHRTKNNDLNPEDFNSGSHKKVWWQCPKGEDHEWEAQVKNRNNGQNCPFCAGRRVSKTNNLLAINPKLASEWHPTKNKGLKPENFHSGSHKRVWWQCPKGEDHEWQTNLVSRSSGEGTKCPFCAGQRVSNTNSLLANNPELAREWHPTKNKLLKPENFTLHSTRMKVWWKCPRGEDHEWATTIASRNAGRNCPFCAGKAVSESNNLLKVNPKLASEWHPTKNNGLTPENFTSGSGKKVWWQCSKSLDHEWETTIASRCNARSCPFCSGNAVTMSNSLLSINPKLASEWHPTKNKGLKPQDFTSGSGKKVWWQCSKSLDHEWETTITSRSRGTNCPFCSSKGTSQPEIRILCELQDLFGSDKVEWRYRLDGVEIDIFISDYNLGIEYDGFYWHKKKLQSDTDKNNFLKKKGIQIIRLRERPLEAISKHDVIVRQDHLTKDDLNSLIHEIKKCVELSSNVHCDKYADKPSFINESGFKRYLSFLPSPPPEYSIMRTHPEISNQWHYEKNSPLKPENFTFGSQKEVWWQCTQNESHYWETTIASRSAGRGCPFCAGRQVNMSNSLLAVNPKLASEWHPTRNKGLKPESFTSGSAKKVWWQCTQDEKHEWEALVKNRNNGQNCPFCAGKKVNEFNSLLAMNPKVASEWHPIKNNDLTPKNVTLMSGKRVWWQCLKIDDHEWEAPINDRSRGGRCPFCYKRKKNK